MQSNNTDAKQSCKLSFFEVCKIYNFDTQSRCNVQGSQIYGLCVSRNEDLYATVWQVSNSNELENKARNVYNFVTCLGTRVVEQKYKFTCYRAPISAILTKLLCLFFLLQEYKKIYILLLGEYLFLSLNFTQL